jgi:hypothetical protein
MDLLSVPWPSSGSGVHRCEPSPKQEAPADREDGKDQRQPHILPDRLQPEQREGDDPAPLSGHDQPDDYVRQVSCYPSSDRPAGFFRGVSIRAGHAS